MKRAIIPAVLALTAACDDPSFPPQACLALQDTEMFIGERETVALCFEDPDGDVFSVTATASDPSVVEAVVPGGGQEILLMGRDVGQAVISVVARDSKGLSSPPQTFLVTVPNRAPVATGQPDSLVVSVGTSSALALSDHFDDPDGQELAYAAESDAAAVTVSVVGDTVTVHAAAAGEARVKITATDGHDQAALFLHVRVRPVREIVFEDDFATDDGSWKDHSYGESQREVKDGKLRMWTPAAGGKASVGRPMQVVNWVVEASVRAAEDAGVTMAMSWRASEGNPGWVHLSVGDLTRGTHYYAFVVGPGLGTPYYVSGVLDDYDPLEYTTVSAEMDDGDFVLKVGDTEIERFEGLYAPVTLNYLRLTNVVKYGPPIDTGVAAPVFVDWVRVSRIVSRADELDVSRRD